MYFVILNYTMDCGLFGVRFLFLGIKRELLLHKMCIRDRNVKVDVPIVADARDALTRMLEYVEPVSYTHLKCGECSDIIFGAAGDGEYR